MPESNKHQELVRLIRKYVISLVHEDYVGLIEADLPEEKNRPSLITDDYIPDVYYLYNDLLIIGEAKTENDMSNRHCYNQFNSYFNECKNFIGDSILIITVPLMCVPKAKNYFHLKENKKTSRMKIIVMNELGDVFLV